MRLTRIGILIFTAAAVAGPSYTVERYSSISDVISLLGAQNTPNNFIMVAGFLALSIGIIVDGVRQFSKPTVPFIAFGLCMGLAGLVAHRPLSPDVAFSLFAHHTHSALATLAGIFITVGLLWQAARQSLPRPRAIAIALAALCFGLPLCMLAFPGIQGFIQRLMYFLMFIWLWTCYPLTNLTTKEPKATGEPLP